MHLEYGNYRLLYSFMSKFGTITQVDNNKFVSDVIQVNSDIFFTETMEVPVEVGEAFRQHILKPIPQ